MTVIEFEKTCGTIACQKCGNLGLEVYRPINGNHVGAQCPRCGSKTPMAGVQWFAQNGSSQAMRRTRRSVEELREVWVASGDHCGFCGKSWDLCCRLKIGRTVQHVHPVMFGGAEAGLLIPFCARCQEMSRAALLETRDVMNEFESLEQVLIRLRLKYGEV